MEELGVESFDARCRRCFRQLAGNQTRVQLSEEIGETPSSSGSSSESDSSQ